MKKTESSQISGGGGGVMLVVEFSTVFRVGTGPFPLLSNGQGEPKGLDAMEDTRGQPGGLSRENWPESLSCFASASGP